MSFRSQLTKLLQLFHRQPDLTEEIQIHLQMEANENIESGMSPDEAHYAARRSFGNVTQAAESTRQMWGWHLTEQLSQDLRFGFRQIRRNLSFSFTAILTLALGLGATMAIFSLTNALLLKRLPVPNPDQLVGLEHGEGDEHDNAFSYPLLAEITKRNTSGIQLFGLSSTDVKLSSPFVHRTVSAQVTTENAFNVLQLRPQMGRLFGPYTPASSAILSNAIWRTDFNADPNILGKQIQLDGLPFVVTGVLPADFLSFSPGDSSDLVITFAGYELLNNKNSMLTCRNCYWLQAMGRLNPDINMVKASAGLQLAWQSARRAALPETLPARYQASYFAEKLSLSPAGNGLESILRYKFVKPLYLLLGMSSLILLIACSNVANLLLARAQARSGELAIRLSTGASRRRITQQFLTESLLLAILGLTVSVAFYRAFTLGLVAFLVQSGETISLDTTPDWHMISFATALLTLTVLLFGLVPAIRASNLDLSAGMAKSSRTLAGKASPSRMILASQIGISVILLTGAILLSRSLYELKTFNAGFRRDHLVIASINFGDQITSPAGKSHFADIMLQRLREFPGVKSASASTLVPASGFIDLTDYTSDGYIPNRKTDTTCNVNSVTSHFFETMGTPLLAGRDFSDADSQPKSLPVAIISETLAHQLFRNENPIGKTLHELEKQPRLTIIGVARDANQTSLRSDTHRTVYLPFPQPTKSNWGVRFEIWTAASPESMLRSLRSTFENQDANVQTTLRTFNEVIDRRLLYERLLRLVSVSFGILGLLMSAIGIYGVAAYSVTRRLLEVGIRQAIGASKPQIIYLFLREHSVVIAFGVFIGVVGALTLTKYLHTWLFGVSPLDALSFAISALLLSAVSALSILVPAFNALRLEPSRLLRQS